MRLVEHQCFDIGRPKAADEGRNLFVVDRRGLNIVLNTCRNRIVGFRGILVLAVPGVQCLVGNRRQEAGFVQRTAGPARRKIGVLRAIVTKAFDPLVPDYSGGWTKSAPARPVDERFPDPASFCRTRVQQRCADACRPDTARRSRVRAPGSPATDSETSGSVCGFRGQNSRSIPPVLWPGAQAWRIEVIDPCGDPFSIHDSRLDRFPLSLAYVQTGRGTSPDQCKERESGCPQ